MGLLEKKELPTGFVCHLRVGKGSTLQSLHFSNKSIKIMLKLTRKDEMIRALVN